jgi:hypothetical protein
MSEPFGHLAELRIPPRLAQKALRTDQVSERDIVDIDQGGRAGEPQIQSAIPLVEDKDYEQRAY